MESDVPNENQPQSNESDKERLKQELESVTQEMNDLAQKWNALKQHKEYIEGQLTPETVEIRTFPILGIKPEIDGATYYCDLNVIENQYKTAIMENHGSSVQDFQILMQRGGLGLAELYAAVFQVENRDLPSVYDEAGQRWYIERLSSPEAHHVLKPLPENPVFDKR